MENLGNALKEVQKTRDLKDMKCDLNAYRLYCERAADMLDETKDKAPGATQLVRKGLPIIDKRIKQILAEIDGKAKALYNQTQYSQFADLGNELNKARQILSNVGNPIALDKAIRNMQTVLSAICAKMPEDEKGEACELLKQSKDEPYVEDRINLTNMVLSKISSQMDLSKKTNSKKTNYTVIGGTMNIESVGGDKIVANHSSIVSKSSFSNAINSIEKSGNDEIAKAIKDLAKLIENANFENKKETIENVESLAEEAAKQNPRKGTMRALGESILNSVQKISEIVAKVSPLIKIISKLWL